MTCHSNFVSFSLLLSIQPDCVRNNHRLIRPFNRMPSPSPTSAWSQCSEITCLSDEELYISISRLLGLWVRLFLLCSRAYPNSPRIHLHIHVRTLDLILVFNCYIPRCPVQIYPIFHLQNMCFQKQCPSKQSVTWYFTGCQQKREKKKKL